MDGWRETQEEEPTESGHPSITGWGSERRELSGGDSGGADWAPGSMVVHFVPMKNTRVVTGLGRR